MNAGRPPQLSLGRSGLLLLVLSAAMQHTLARFTDVRAVFPSFILSSQFKVLKKGGDRVTMGRLAGQAVL